MKYKFILVLLCVSAFAMSQESDDQPRSFLADDGDFGVMLNLNGLVDNIALSAPTDQLGTPSVLLRYRKNERWTYRLGFAPSIYNFNITSADSVGKDLIRLDSTSSQSMFSVIPGVEYHFEGSRRLDPYITGEVALGAVGRSKIQSNRTVTDTTGTGSVNRNIQQDGGFLLGVRSSVGVNYFISKRLFLGAEFGMALSNVSSGGDREEVVITDPISGVQSTVRNISSSRVSTTTFMVDPNVNLVLGFYFSKRNE